MLDGNDKRDYSLDWLKTIGTFCLFLAHVDAPFWIKEIRAFDVPLMIFISGLLVRGSISRSTSYSSYVLKRVKRLVVPTWLFLLFFYVCMAIVGRLPDYITILKSFLFQRDGGIAGYTWIIWVYIICGVLAPILIKIPIKTHAILIVILIIAIYESIASFTDLAKVRILYYTVFTVLPYGLFMLFAVKYEELSIKQKMISVILFAVFHIVYVIMLFFVRGGYISLGDYKYPARLYYFSYALPISICLLGAFRMEFFKNKRYRIIDFISKHSLWIYLWHILVLSFLKYVIHLKNWFLCFLLIVVLSLGITFIQSQLVYRIQKKHNAPFLKYLLG